MLSELKVIINLTAGVPRWMQHLECNGSNRGTPILILFLNQPIHNF
jgi:hypothetical protein